MALKHEDRNMIFDNKKLQSIKTAYFLQFLQTLFNVEKKSLESHYILFPIGSVPHLIIQYKDLSMRLLECV